MKTRMKTMRFLPLIAAAGLFNSPLLPAQVVSTTEHQELTPQGVSSTGRFGRELSMSGDTLIVGAPWHFETGSEDGVVHIYVRESGSWVLQQVLNSPDPQPGTRFGSSVAVDADRALIGAVFDGEMGTGSGAVHVYERTGTTWSRAGKLFDETPGNNFNFGSQVALDGDHILIAGRDYADIGAPNEVHSFWLENGTWQYGQALKYSGPVFDSPSGPLNPGAEDFGRYISIDGNRAAITTLLNVQTFERSGTSWSPQQTLSTNSGGGLMFDVDLDQDALAISYRLLNGSASEGIADVFRLSGNGWFYEASLRPSGQSESTTYGNAAELEGGLIALGATGFAISPQVGEVTIFERTASGWTETQVLQDSQQLENSRFGSTLALSDGQLVVGAYTEGPAQTGSAYAFDLNERPLSFCESDGGDAMGCGVCPCSNDAPTGSTGGCLNATGNSASLKVSGAPSVTNDTLRMELAGANPSTFAILLSGAQRAPNNTMNPCFGTGSGITANALGGLRCVVQNIRRQGTRATDAQGAVGETNNGWGGTDGPVAGLLAQAGLVAGQTRHYQAFYRETPTAGCMRDQNTSQGISITVRP